MNWLAFETSALGLTVAIGEGEAVKAHRDVKKPHQQAEMLVPTIETALEDAALGYEDLQGIVTSRGPGSFTGVRIALATARGLALAADRPLIGCTTLECLAWEVASRGVVGEIAVALDARRGQCFWQVFDAKAMPLTEPSLHEIAVVQSQLAARSGLRHLVGSAAGLFSFQEALETLEQKAHSNARMLLRWVASQSQENTSPPSVTPLYIRPPDAKLPMRFSQKVQQQRF